MNIMDFIEENSLIIVLSLMVSSILFVTMIIVLFIRMSKLNKKYKKFMAGASGENLESQILSRFAAIDKLEAETKNINQNIEKIKENLLLTYQKIGVVKYDAFKEMGGKLSFVLVLLNKENTGFLLNSVHSSREGCYTYLKEIIKGESFLELSEDEKKALSQAVNCNNYME